MNNDINTNKLEKKDLKKVFWRSFTLEASFNYERLQALGYAYSMIPIIKKLYKTKEKISAALKRHMEFFNTTPHVSTFVMGVTSAMEEQNSIKEDFDSESINAVKAGLMGPVAGIGDSFFWGTFKVIAAGIGTSLAIKGNFLGVILFLLMFNVPHYLVRYYGLFLGYNAGGKFLESAYKNGKMEKITFSASIVGLMVIGAMTGTMVEFTTPVVFNAGGTSLELQEVFNQILPQLLPLALTGFIFWQLKKNVKINYILIGLLAFGVLGKLIGIV